MFVFYFPGKFILRVTKFRFDDFVITSASALASGMCIFLLVSYLLAWVHAAFLGCFGMLLLSASEVFQLFRSKKKIKIRNLFTIELLIIFFGSFAMAYLMWWSGMPTNNGLAFYSINATDAIYHLSLIGNLIYHFPPTHAGLEGISLRGYHFFYDFLLANFSKTFGFSTLDLYFRLFPFFIAFFYGIAGFALAKFLQIDKLSTKIFLFLLYFADGFGFFVTEYFHSIYSTGIIQSIAHILDPNVIFSVGILFCSVVLIFNVKSISQLILTAIAIGVLPDIKIYTAVIIFGALFITALFALVRDKKWIYIKTLFLSSVIAGIVYLPINYGAGKLVFAPFLLYKHFMESAFLFSNFQWAYKYQFYSYHENYFRLASLLLIAVFLFFLPSLGLRLIALGYAPKLLQKKFYTLPHVFWLSAISITFIIPTFFIQNISVFVIIQFLWFGYILLLLPTGSMFGQLLNNAYMPVIALFFGILIFLSMQNIIISIKTFTQNPTYISMQMVSMGNFIKKEIPQDKNLMMLNRVRRENTNIDMYNVPIVSALSMHSMYYEPEVLDFNGMEQIVNQRKNIIDQIQKITYTCDVPAEVNKKIDTIMKHTNNQYILAFINTSCFDKLQSFIKIHKEGELALYKIL